MATEKSFGALLIEGLKEAVAFDRGELKDARVRRVPVTAREAEVPEPPRYDARRILTIRQSLNVSQPVFASMLNVSSGTVKAWEQGVREPEGPTRRLLEVAERHPEAIAAGLGTQRRASLPRTVGGTGRRAQTAATPQRLTVRKG